ncbi:hypothetical protein AVEN_131498-1 [Araneus ventricosus]|uniref:DUF4817 domain-containing protein n=1 Tax=Araneus ventricosus TaxID=182803 RepID=A0A4Y2EW36_ARAVE|nr:hypothetical protein AVEN_131498-1 [Araneus ventricosus]
MRRGPSDNAIKALFGKFERTRNVNDDRIGNVGRQRSAFTESNDDAVLQVMRQQPRTSVHSFAFHAGLTPKNGHALYYVRNLYMFPYKIQTCHPLSVNAIDARYHFANAMQQIVDFG